MPRPPPPPPIFKRLTHVGVAYLGVLQLSTTLFLCMSDLNFTSESAFSGIWLLLENGTVGAVPRLVLAGMGRAGKRICSEVLSI